MDEYIYILLAIAWVIFSLYKKGSKQQKQKEQAAREAQDNAEQAEPSTTKSMLEQLILGEEFKQPVTAKPVTEAPEIYETYDYDAIQKEEAESLEDDVPDYSDMNKPQIFVPGKTDNSYALKKKRKREFDLKQAVIYSTILDRPYK